jgi:hypothetical protein
MRYLGGSVKKATTFVIRLGSVVRIHNGPPSRQFCSSHFGRQPRISTNGWGKARLRFPSHDCNMSKVSSDPSASE